MSASENKALITRIFDGLAQGDGALFVQHLHEDAVMTVTGSYSWSRQFHGKESILRDLYGHVRSVTTGTSRTIPDNILADEDWVIVEARGDMTAKDGTPYRNSYCLMYRLRDGMIVEAKEYQDSALCEAVLGPFPSM